VAADATPVGLVAGYGRLPFLVAEGVRKSGREVVIIGLQGWASHRLAGFADVFLWSSVVRVGRITGALKSRGVRQAVLVGGVRKREMYSPLRLLRYIPDLRTARLWYFRIRKDKRDNAVLLATAEELRNQGIEVVSYVKYCQEHLAGPGLMTRTPVPRSAEQDVEFGWKIARASAEMDIGQAVAVKERDIIAVEAMEGTDAMIRRAGRLCRVGDWTLVKVARPKQDMRFDIPTIGPDTMRNLSRAKCACLVVEAGRTLIVDKPATLALADKLDIAVVGKQA